MKKLKWGIMGNASIAKRAFIPGVRESELCVVEAIASREESKAKMVAEQFGISKSFGSYEDLLEDPSIDAVYIPLPNHLHKEWTIKAAKAGKHILCEKPIALNVKEAEEMAEACAKAGVKLAEAFMYRHHPRYQMLKEIISSGEIGDIRVIRGAFTFNNSANMENIRFKREWGGGSIYDVGCYPINAARYLLEREPEAVTVHALLSPQHDYVDMMASGLVEFPESVALIFDCGMWAANRSFMEIVGTNGRIDLPSGFGTRPEPITNLFVTIGGERKEIEVPHVNHYAIQADNFARSVLHGEPLSFEPSDFISNMRVLEACIKSANERTRVVL
ncbi:Gfo/Idh/MocA family protein [Paenibacillus cremeus]|uniref:Gfo/Idh/MocA family oxidoreductase n=1 Tax=Paenibacillus cremeus TaxID=2163881 RepID=A0A559K5V8_9BACL|nr:Gfo/Idh/MocA family oxidoreductase [Paenibacillus cremeus]TVY07512.1 Gfo/Idh/MocA family oxidoreductase [Paenibacillus cremeus]